jgi:excisionase family DNA binding protein
MSKDVFIPVPLDEFNAKVESLVRKAVKEGIQQKSNAGFELVTIEELMQILKVTKMSIHNWRKEGWLPYYKLGSNVRFKLEEVMEAIEKRNGRKGKRTNKKNLSA